MRTSLLLMVAASLVLGMAAATRVDAQVPSGSGKQSMASGETQLDIFTYRPACRDPSLLLVKAT